MPKILRFTPNNKTTQARRKSLNRFAVPLTRKEVAEENANLSIIRDTFTEAELEAIRKELDN